MNEIKAIETQYAGITFRSRLEARWAVVFDKLGITWVYEHEGYETPFGKYVPDFWLPDVYMRDDKHKGVYFEVKPVSYADYLHPALEYVCNSLSVSGVLAKGFPNDEQEVSECLWEIAKDWDCDMTIRKCKHGHITFDYCEYVYDECPLCKSPTDYLESVRHAIETALQNRFW